MIKLKSVVVEAQTVSYSAVVLDDRSRNLLISKSNIPEGWEVLCHHMTINMGELRDKSLLGKECTLTAKAVASDDKVMAVQVDTDVESSNKIKHITVAVNRQNGGKPFFSNKLTNWTPIEPFTLKGVIQEVMQS